jgi:hypothetical protein
LLENEKAMLNKIELQYENGKCNTTRRNVTITYHTWPSGVIFSCDAQEQKHRIAPQQPVEVTPSRWRWPYHRSKARHGRKQLIAAFFATPRPASGFPEKKILFNTVLIFLKGIFFICTV